jgi:hypothetical protein
LRGGYFGKLVKRDLDRITALLGVRRFIAV